MEFFKTKRSFTTALSEDEILKSIARHTTSLRRDNDQRVEFFGEVKSNPFEIEFSRYYSRNDRIRPSITFNISSEVGFSNVNLNFGLPAGHKSFLILIIIFNAIAISVLGSIHNHLAPPADQYWYLVIPFVLLSVAIWVLIYFFRAYEAYGTIKEILKSK